jgi:hypothetical protein
VGIEQSKRLVAGSASAPHRAEKREKREERREKRGEARRARQKPEDRGDIPVSS